MAVRLESVRPSGPLWSLMTSKSPASAHPGEGVQQLGLRLAELVGAALREPRDEPCARPRVAGGEKGHVVPCLREAFHEQAHDGLRAAVADGRHGEPWGRDDADAQDWSGLGVRGSSRQGTPRT